MAHRLGVHLTQKPVASIGLGALSVSPLDMAAAYATFASGGIYARPTAIRKVILPNGKIDKTWSKPQTKRVLSQGVAYEVTKVLGENALYGTGAGSGDGIHPNAGKTGTTNDHADAWFDGYTRDFSTVVWMGYPRGEIPMENVHGQAVAGATFPVPIWHLYMEQAEKGRPVRQFQTPSSYPTFSYWHKNYYGYLAIQTTPATTTTTTTTATATPQPSTPKVKAEAEPHARHRALAPGAASGAGAGAGRAARAVSDELLSITEALELVLERVMPLEAEDVPLDEAAGRVLAASASAAVDLPSFPASAMDGFALRAADAPATLPVVARIAAGRPAAEALEAGQAMAIATGGVVPDGADSVVPIEDVEERDGVVVVPGAVETGANVQAAGRRSRRRRRRRPCRNPARARPPRRARRGRRDARELLEAAAGRARGDGHRAALARRAARPGEIYDANGVILATQIGSTGASVDRLPPVTDDAEPTRAAVERGLAADVLVTSGGVSVGVYDLVRATEAELGVEEVFWRVSVRPGKPVAFGVRGRTLVFGLPGNPVSSLVGFELFVRPALLALQGLAEPRPALPARAAGADGAGSSRRDSLLRARTRVEDGSVVLDPLTGQESHMIAHAATADALVLVPGGDGELAAGSGVSLPAAVGSRRDRTASTLRRTASRNGPRGPALARGRVRGIATRGGDRELRRGRRPGQHDQHAESA